MEDITFPWGGVQSAHEELADQAHINQKLLTKFL